jgi:TonB family protein
MLRTLRARFWITLLLVSSFTLAQDTSSTPKAALQAESSRSIAALDSRSLVFRTIVPINYPQAAQDSGTGGLVVVRMTVNESGDLESAEIVSGESVLAGTATEAIKYAATEAIKQWKFQPHRQTGQGVDKSRV